MIRNPIQHNRKTEAELEKLVRIFRKVAMSDYSEKPEIPDAAIEKGDLLTQVSVALRFMIEDLESSHHEQERSRQLLQEERSRLVSSINSLALGFAILDKQGSVLLSNKTLDKLLGGASPQSLSDIAAPFDTSINLEKYYKKVISDGSSFDKHEAKFQSLYLHIYLAPIRVSESGKIIGATILIEDITEAKLLERSKNEFFSIASHELRTPLTAIRGNASMILGYFPEATRNRALQDAINDIHESSVRLINIVNDFLEASRLEQGKIVFNTQVFQISDTIGSVIHEMESMLKEKGITLTYDHAPNESPPLVVADPERVKQIIYNLVGNAAKFTVNGAITIYALPRANKLRVFISDTGCGIGPEDQRLLFHKFQQASGKPWTRDSSKGTGLGLYISKLLAESMGGSMQLERSALGKGSTFSFTVPLSSPCVV